MVLGMTLVLLLARITVALRDLPGSLAQVTSSLASLGANIEEVHHQRTFTHLPLQSTEVEFVIQTRNHAAAGRQHWTSEAGAVHARR